MEQLVKTRGENYQAYREGDSMEEVYRKELEYWEYLAHLNAFKPMGKNYWDNFLAREVYYNAKFKKYNRRW